MPQRRRFVPPGSILHIVNRGNDKKIIFPELIDYAAFLVLLREARERFVVKLYAYCLMPNHFHLVVAVDYLRTCTGFNVNMPAIFGISIARRGTVTSFSAATGARPVKTPDLRIASQPVVRGWRDDWPARVAIWLTD